MIRKFASTLSTFVALMYLALALPNSAVASPVETIAPSALEARIASNKGYLVVNITSTDPKCGYCAQANPKFMALANHTENMQFVQVGWEPWRQFPNEIREYLARIDIQGIPARVSYLDSKMEGKQEGVPPDVPPPSPLKVTGDIPVISSRDIAAKIQHTKGLVIVQLTSFETTCDFCIRSNPVYERLAKDTASSGITFLRVAYRPWLQLTIDPFAQTFGFSGLPIYAVYKDGKFVRKHGGHAEQPELQKLLLNGLK